MRLKVTLQTEWQKEGSVDWWTTGRWNWLVANGRLSLGRVVNQCRLKVKGAKVYNYWSIQHLVDSSTSLSQCQDILRPKREGLINKSLPLQSPLSSFLPKPRSKQISFSILQLYHPFPMVYFRCKNIFCREPRVTVQPPTPARATEIVAKNWFLFVCLLRTFFVIVFFSSSKAKFQW